MKQFLIHRWFLLLLLTVLALGVGLHDWLQPLVKFPPLRQSVVATVMFLMALPLRANAMWDALRRPGPPLLASGINYGLVPLACWAATTLLALALLIGQDTRFGMLVAATTPCTLASASVWTRRAGGNDAVSILVTILTNSLCFLIMPAWLLVMIGEIPQFQPLEMIAKLGLLVVLPMAIAQLLRLRRSVGEWATGHKTAIGVAAQVGVLSMVFFGAIQTGEKLSANHSQAIWLEMAAMVVTILSIHTVVLLIALRSSRWLGMSRADSTAVGFAGSQKTLMVGLEVSAQLGVTMLPMVTYHVGQLLIDTVVADRLRRQAEREKLASKPDGS